MENKAYRYLYSMKSILRLFLFKPGQILVFVLMHVSVYGQRSHGDKFQELSATVQHYAAKNNMILPKGRYEFYKLDRAILWSYKQDLFWPLNRLILKDKAIRDSMTDELYINFDREYNRFVMDVYESPYKFNEADHLKHFPCKAHSEVGCHRLWSVCPSFYWIIKYTGASICLLLPYIWIASLVLCP